MDAVQRCVVRISARVVRYEGNVFGTRIATEAIQTEGQVIDVDWRASTARDCQVFSLEVLIPRLQAAFLQSTGDQVVQEEACDPAHGHAGLQQHGDDVVKLGDACKGINFKIPLQPNQKDDATQYEEFGFS